MGASNLIDGRAIAEQIHAETAQRVAALKAKGVQPGLVFVRVGEDPASKVYVGMKGKMSAIEEKLIQVKMKSSEGNLVYPNQLNEEFYTFSRAVEADAAPTEPQLEVFKMLDGRLEEQLQAWAQLKADEVPKINELIKQADVPALTVAEAAKPSPTPAGSPSPTSSPQGN